MLQVHYLLLESWILMFKQTDSGSWLLGMFIPDVNTQNVFTCRECYSDILFLVRAFGLGEDTTQIWNKPPPCYT